MLPEYFGVFIDHPQGAISIMSGIAIAWHDKIINACVRIYACLADAE